ncbi:hypothetical protein BC939DRAFT_491324 [Gamsiella multidivaricata]|uniref:uncharacterized protein n=1 Tax=Gamsiella multidivaricata TaxID=101098 RepID=UPI002220E500|nr:uncharacterized protein BC939DRAFT_491324 [Gamsiella multidivaricata]KAG0363461.1 hypothetical protein BGZ54_008148 [Gamsiella multidivaricata]KAI7827417.1 hypothetical protein BC939DRAFT_491324 [Gamsiella multidivaricata]
MGFWTRSAPVLTQEYQESVAHRVRDILTGVDHSSHAHRNKAAIKALQKPEALAGVIEILRAMPEPSSRAGGWDIDEGIDLDSEEEQQDRVRSPKIQGLFKGKERAGNINDKKDPKPKGTTVVAATTIAAAAATSAAAATLAVAKGRSSKRAVKEEEITVEVTDKTETTTTKRTVVRFHPSKDTVSSQAYWWGYEIFIPQEALARIASAQDVSSAFLGFLGSVGLVVPAIVPFLGYIAAYVGLEFAVIKAQNEGRGVILASTWLVPVALVPRAWDVPDEDGIEDNSGCA